MFILKKAIVQRTTGCHNLRNLKKSNRANDNRGS
jgi:hypothetical protein